jgi:hypothetical protein
MGRRLIRGVPPGCAPIVRTPIVTAATDNRPCLVVAGVQPATTEYLPVLLARILGTGGSLRWASVTAAAGCRRQLPPGPRPGGPDAARWQRLPLVVEFLACALSKSAAASKSSRRSKGMPYPSQAVSKGSSPVAFVSQSSTRLQRRGSSSWRMCVNIRSRSSHSGVSTADDGRCAAGRGGHVQVLPSGSETSVARSRAVWGLQRRPDGLPGRCRRLAREDGLDGCVLPSPSRARRSRRLTQHAVEELRLLCGGGPAGE